MWEWNSSRTSSLSYGQGLSKVLLFRDDEKRAVGVGPDVLSIHMLRPYQVPEKRGWDEFDRTGPYWQVAEPRPRIGYINRIVIPEPVVKIHYLRCASPSVQGLPSS